VIFWSPFLRERAASAHSLTLEGVAMFRPLRSPRSLEFRSETAAR
jgi:hypothetical protein